MVHNSLYNAYVYINCSIMFVKVDNIACPTPMPEATYSIQHPTPSAFMPEVTGMVACPIFISYVPNESLLSSSHSHDCHVRCSISHSKYQ